MILRLQSIEDLKIALVAVVLLFAPSMWPLVSPDYAAEAFRPLDVHHLSAVGPVVGALGPWIERPDPPPPKSTSSPTQAYTPVADELSDSTLCPPCTVDLSVERDHLHVELNGQLDVFVPDRLEVTTDTGDWSWSVGPGELDGDYTIDPSGATFVEVRVVMESGEATKLEVTLIPPS